MKKLAFQVFMSERKQIWFERKAKTMERKQIWFERKAFWFERKAKTMERKQIWFERKAKTLSFKSGGYSFKP